MSFKVVIINKSAKGGGAAVAASRLVNALKSNEVDVSMLIQDPIYENDVIHTISNTKKEKYKAFGRFIKERLYFLPFEKNKSVRYSFSPAVAGIDISEHPLIKEADIIHLHWINHGFLSMESLDKLFSLNKPIVWTLHDMWPFTGGCHYAGSCYNFIDSCGFCPCLRKPDKNDLSSKVLEQKKEIWNKTDLNIITCSKWLGSLAKESFLLRGKTIISIPNPIDTDVFAPRNKVECRKKLNLPVNKRLILFGAANVNDPRKGMIYLINALNNLNKEHPEWIDTFELIVFGKNRKTISQKLPFTTHIMEFISDTDMLIDLYNAADAFVLPSLQDNLPNTVMESLACGVPVISFRVGGVPEMIEHNRTGYLAEARDSKSLAKGIDYILNQLNSAEMSQNAREFALKNYSNQIVSSQFVDFYKKVLHI